MNSPEIVPNPRKPMKPKRKCRRRLELSAENKENDLNSTIEEDYSPDVSEYIPSESTTSISSMDSSPTKKNAKIPKILKNQNGEHRRELTENCNANSLFSTPTSSKLASCVPSPLLRDINDNSPLFLSNVEDFFDNLENIEPNVSTLNSNFNVSCSPITPIFNDGDSLKKNTEISSTIYGKCSAKAVSSPRVIDIPEPYQPVDVFISPETTKTLSNSNSIQSSPSTSPSLLPRSEEPVWANVHSDESDTAAVGTNYNAASTPLPRTEDPGLTAAHCGELDTAAAETDHTAASTPAPRTEDLGSAVGHSGESDPVAARANHTATSMQAPRNGYPGSAVANSGQSSTAAVGTNYTAALSLATPTPAPRTGYPGSAVANSGQSSTAAVGTNHTAAPSLAALTPAPRTGYPGPTVAHSGQSNTAAVGTNHAHKHKTVPRTEDLGSAAAHSSELDTAASETDNTAPPTPAPRTKDPRSSDAHSGELETVAVETEHTNARTSVSSTEDTRSFVNSGQSSTAAVGTNNTAAPSLAAPTPAPRTGYPGPTVAHSGQSNTAAVGTNHAHKTVPRTEDLGSAAAHGELDTVAVETDHTAALTPPSSTENLRSTAAHSGELGTAAVETDHTDTLGASSATPTTVPRSENSGAAITNSPQDESISKNSRKRKRNPANWKDNTNKEKKNTGKAYVGTRNKKERDEKVLGESCSCKRRCYSKIDPEMRKMTFKYFWALGSHERQWDFILRHISSNNIKCMTLERKLNRTQTIVYKLPNNRVMKENTVVCKKMFLNTLAITQRVVYTAIEKKEGTLTDLRGRHETRPRKTNEFTEQSIIQHIQQFPVVESHYIRKTSSKLYLNETLNISKMYRLYKTWYAEQPDYEPDKLGTKSQYETVFNQKFNYSFFKPKKDQCETCFVYKTADLERKSQLEESYQNHIKEKEIVRELKNTEKSDSDIESKTVACFDLEKVLYIPQSEISSFFYKRKYAVYNFTIFDLLSKQGHCFVWHQQIAKRGAIEIGSCLWLFLNNEAQNGKKEVSFYSDSCTGQNRNRYIFALYQYASKVLGIDITHRFFVKGHSQSEGDSMHSCVERSKKNHVIYNPDQMYSIIENAKIEGKKFSVKHMQQTDFLDIKQLVTGRDKNWLLDDNGQKVYWSRVREVKIYRGEPGKIYLKYALAEASDEIVINTNRISSRRRRRNVEQTDCEEIVVAYNEPIPVPMPLYRDLMSLCNTGAIPAQYHAFYRSLMPTIIQEGIEENDDESSDLSD